MTTVSIKIISVYYCHQVMIMVHSCPTCCSSGLLSAGFYAVRWAMGKLLHVFTQLCRLFQLKVKICEMFILS